MVPGDAYGVSEPSVRGLQLHTLGSNRMLSQEEILEKLVESWRNLKESNFPPQDPIKLLEYDQSIVYIEESWGPAVPYPAVDHRNGRKITAIVVLREMRRQLRQFQKLRDFLNIEIF